MTRLVLTLLALACAVSAAEAQAGKQPSPEGEWTFVSGEMPQGCIFSGVMTMKKISADAFACSFSARWSCTSGMPHRIDTEQSCTASQKGADITIASKLDKIVSTDPASMLGEMRARYLADQFTAQINADGDEMDGQSFDQVNHAKVKFRRKQDLVS